MNEMKVFSNQEFGKIRTVTIDGELWFVGKDIAEALGYENPQKAVRTHVDEEDKGVTQMDTPGGKQKLAIINESGLYALIFGSKLERAKQFKHWVTSEVLPSIRKTGSYLSEADTKILNFIESYQQFMESQEKFNQMVIEKLESSQCIQVHQFKNDMEDCSILVEEENESQRRGKMLNQLVVEMATARGWDKDFALHRLYKTLGKALGISLDGYLEIYRAETGNTHASTWKMITGYNQLYKTAVQLCINTINSMKC